MYLFMELIRDLSLYLMKISIRMFYFYSCYIVLLLCSWFIMQSEPSFNILDVSIFGRMVITYIFFISVYIENVKL